MKIVKDENGDDKITVDNIDDFYILETALEQLKEKAVPVVNAYMELEGIKPQYGIDEDEIEFGDGYVNIRWDDCRCGYCETEYASMPAEYLFNDNWIVDAKKKIEERKEQERLAKEKKSQEAKQRAKEAEYKKFLELKEKFGDSNVA